MSEKKLTNEQLLGEQGIALISLAVSRLGYVWRPTSQHDTGIDGEIEIRDTTSGAVSGLILKVQSKAVSAFQNEAADTFDYWPKPSDVQYWLGHNVPVLLVVSRPETNEIYWQSVEANTGPSAQKRFRFTKSADKLDAAAVGRLAELARGGALGAKGYALAKPERLLSNLLPVVRLPERLYLAEASYNTAKDLGPALFAAGVQMEFVLKNKRVLSVRDLTDPRFASFCDRGTVEDFPVSEWANSLNADKQRDFVALLNQCLRQFLRESVGHLRVDKESGAFYFPSNQTNTPYEYGYRGNKKDTARDVVKALKNKKLGHIMGFRHSAMFTRFFQYSGAWYLEVTPTYIFTQPDGRTPSQYHSAWLAGIKKLEVNSAVFGQLGMWEELFTNVDMLSDEYPFLRFGRLLDFRTVQGIEDSSWEAPPKAQLNDIEGHLESFFG